MADLTRNVSDLLEDMTGILLTRMVLPLEDAEIARMLAALQLAISRRMLEAREELLTAVRWEVHFLLECELRRRRRMLEPSAS